MQFACSTKIEETNDQFRKKYGKQVNNILNNRQNTVIAQSIRRDVRINKTPSKNESLIRSMTARGYFDGKPNSMEDFRLKLQSELGEYIVDNQSFVRNLGTDPELADVTYNFDNNPSEYKRDIVSFDNIKIPSQDYFGIKSNLEEKQYDAPNQVILQQNIDEIHKYFDQDNRDFNRILLQEKEDIRKAKMAKLFLENRNAEVLSEEEIKQKELDQKEAEKEKEEGNNIKYTTNTNENPAKNTGKFSSMFKGF